MAKIVLVEDSERMIEELEHLIRTYLKIEFADVEVITTEAEFFEHAEHWTAGDPLAFVIDVMIPFTITGVPTDHVPQEWEKRATEDRFYRAGVRCYQYLQTKPRLRNTPVFLHSILSKNDIESDANYQLPESKTLFVCPKEANGRGIIEKLSAVAGLGPGDGHGPHDDVT